jgi:hypothetical protein
MFQKTIVSLLSANIPRNYGDGMIHYHTYRSLFFDAYSCGKRSQTTQSCKIVFLCLGRSATKSRLSILLIPAVRLVRYRHFDHMQGKGSSRMVLLQGRPNRPCSCPDQWPQRFSLPIKRQGGNQSIILLDPSIRQLQQGNALHMA